jgi:hypothetical protein
MIELTLEEAKEIMQASLDEAKDGTKFESFPATIQLQALTGIVQTVISMQTLGWRVSRPLKVAGE